MMEEELTDEQADIPMDMREFELPPAADLSEEVRNALVRASLTRIWDGSTGLVSGAMALSAVPEGSKTTPVDMWMFLLLRLITRTTDPPVFADEKMDTDGEMEVVDFYSHQDRLRQVLCDYIIADFPSRSVTSVSKGVLFSTGWLLRRVRLATLWMNEEWFNDHVRSQKEPDWVRNIASTCVKIPH